MEEVEVVVGIKTERVKVVLFVSILFKLAVISIENVPTSDVLLVYKENSKPL